MEKLQEVMVNLQEKYSIADEDMQMLADAVSAAFEGENEPAEGEDQGE